MPPNRWQEISRIFDEAMEKEPSERAAFVGEKCGDDKELQAEIEALLVAAESEDSFIDSPAAFVSSLTNPQKLNSGDKLAHFEILSFLGAGGMGEVYLAKDLNLNRQVALKMLPPASQIDPNANKRFLREAQAAASLEHPHICTIHEIGEEGGYSFIVMQYVQGETVSTKIKERSLTLSDALDITIQIADALSEAHKQGIVHRDIKPANIIVTANNQAVVLDFGLAKRVTFSKADAESSLKTLLSQPGMILGTVGYMSPEQVRGHEVDARTDIWSLGVVLYEMVSGQTPFPGENTVERLAAILHKEPELDANLSSELSGVLEKALKKTPDKRYQNIEEIASDLRKIKQEIDFEAQLTTHITTSGEDLSLGDKMSQYLAEHPTIQTGALSVKSTSSSYLGKGLALAAIVILLVGGWYGWKVYRLSRARENLKRVKELATLEKNFEAYDLARDVESELPGDPALVEIWPMISDTLSVDSEPAGAKVYLRRYSIGANGKGTDREFIGNTPVKELRVARGQYILQIENDGYAPFERTISGLIPRIGGSFIASPPIEIHAKLFESAKNPERMVFVPGSEYTLVNWSRPTEKSVKLNDYFIDKYEVTNREYKEFITAGGYLKKDYWKYPINKDGKEISWEDALKDFRDRTGLPGPRSWSDQNFPEGKADHPVTDITWYEAAAYAEFRGKKLPTVFQWEKAARDGGFDPRYNTMPWGFIRQGETTDQRANFRGTGTVSVANNEFGMSPFGVYNMAGNVSEWCLNQSPEGFVTSGGAWNDLAYSFGDYGEYPGYYSANRIGFRLVQNSPDMAGDQGGQMLPPAETPDYKASSDGDFKTWLSHYDYDKKHLDPKIVERIETNDWLREKIAFVGEGNEQAFAYLYLPKNAAKPLQVLHYVPPGDVVLGLRSLPDSIEMFIAPLIKSGRAVFAVVLKGYNERIFPASYTPPDNGTVEFRKQTVNWMTDLRRSIDYLETRDDLDRSRLGLIGISNGANLGLVLAAIENRYKSLVFVSAGFDKDVRTRITESNPINFCSQIRAPKLLINGRYDETFPYNTDVKPLIKLIREPKKAVTYDGGHIPNPEYYIPVINNWFDESMGPLAR